MENAASYEVTCGDQTKTVKSSPATFTGLAWETVHSFTITAKAEEGSEAYLDSEPFEGKAQVGPQYTALDAPANLKATAMGKRVTITWDAVANAASYEVSCGSSTQTVTTNQATFEMGSSSTEYLVSVVAHPATNSDRYKASEAATTSVMTDGKEVAVEILFTHRNGQEGSFSTTEQIWKVDGVVFTAMKGSSSSSLSNSNYNPLKLSSGHKIRIQSPYKIKKFGISVEKASHATYLQSSLEGMAETLISPSTYLSATPYEDLNTIEFTLTGPAYLKSMTLYYYDGTMPNNNIDDGSSESISAVFGKPWAELPAPSQNASWVEDASRCVKIITDTTVDGVNPRNYSFCYDPTNYVARWVAYPMHNYYTEGSNNSETFYQDPSFSASEQITSTYVSSYGYDRGHQIAKAQRKVSYMARQQTNYYTNMTPQNSSLNGGKWANSLEAKERGSWMCSDTLYVVSGCHYDNYNTIVPNNDGKSCPAPTHYFKVLLRTKAGNTGKPVAECSASELICAGYWVPNVPNSEATITLMSVSEIARLTGFPFFVNVPNAPKDVVSASDWL